MARRHDGKRRRLVAAALACLAAPVHTAADGAATPPDLDTVFALYPQLAALVMPALQHLNRGDHAAAERLLAQASALIDRDPAQRWPFRYYVLPAYGSALLDQGRGTEALALLGQALAARDRILAERLPRFTEVVARLDARLGLEMMRVEYARQLSGMVRTPDTLGNGDDLAYDQRLAASDIWMLLARALAAAGETAALASLFRERIGVIDAADAPALAAHEYRLYKTGMALASAGLRADARAAWQQARAANARRLHMTMRLASPHQVFAAAGLRRLLLSASILAAEADGELARDSPALLADVLASKGAATRYGDAMRIILERADPAQAAQLRALEDEIAQLPASAADARQFLLLVARHDAAWLAAVNAMPLRSAGFEAPDAGLLASLQARLAHEGRAALGFMLLTPPGRRGEAPRRRYLRYAIWAGGIQLRVLGNQSGIDRLVHLCRTELLGGAHDSPAALQLSGLLLDGLPPALHAAFDWTIDPDGALHLLPFDALPGPDGRALLHTHAIRLAAPAGPPAPAAAPDGGQASGPAAVFADPDYGHAGSAVATTMDASAGNAAATLRWWPGAGAPGPVAALPDTRAEARAVAGGLARLGIASQVYLQGEASAAALQALRRPHVLHVAAHAVLRAALEDEDGAAGAEAIEQLLPGRQAGLVLSRAGRADIVLAKDIARLPLQGTALVVLSACDTGNGDLTPGEAVASLRRAVELAGARSAVTALWQVPSAATTALMAAFYARLAQGDSIGQALRGAKLALQADGAAPRAWAGFQLSGEDRALGRPR